MTRLAGAFIQAGQQAGYPYTPDANGEQQEGFGPMDRTTHQGRRWSTARGYLSQAETRPNLTVVSGALAGGENGQSCSAASMIRAMVATASTG